MLWCVFSTLNIQSQQSHIHQMTLYNTINCCCNHVLTVSGSGVIQCGTKVIKVFRLQQKTLLLFFDFCFPIFFYFSYSISLKHVDVFSWNCQGRRILVGNRKCWNRFMILHFRFKKWLIWRVVLSAGFSKN